MRRISILGLTLGRFASETRAWNSFTKMAAADLFLNESCTPEAGEFVPFHKIARILRLVENRRCADCNVVLGGDGKSAYAQVGFGVWVWGLGFGGRWRHLAKFLGLSVRALGLIQHRYSRNNEMDLCMPRR